MASLHGRHRPPLRHRPGNRFWPALHGGGFTPRLFSPFEHSDLLLDLQFGITNVVARAMAADELTDDELGAGGSAARAQSETRSSPDRRRLRRANRSLPDRYSPARKTPASASKASPSGREPRRGSSQPQRPQRPLQAGRLRAPLRRGARLRRRYAACASSTGAAVASATEAAVICTRWKSSSSPMASGGMSTTTSPSGRTIAPRRRAASVT